MTESDIITAWDVTYRPFKDAKGGGDCDVLSDEICDLLWGDEPHPLSSWGKDIGISANLRDGYVTLSFYPEDYVHQPLVPSVEILRRDVADFFAKLDMEGTFTIEPVITVMKDRDE